MSEQVNTRLVQQTYQNLKSGNLQAFLNSLAVDVQWQLPEMENVPFAGQWPGREQVGQFFSIIGKLQDIVEFEPKEFMEQGDKVVVLGHFTMRIKSTGRDFSSDWAHIWTIKNGQINHFREYVDTAIVSRAYTAAKASYKT
jgi:ketosteroid isomerase-like protein